MSIERSPLKVLVVSGDTALLHDVTWVLSAVGYSVETTKDFETDALWRRYAEADFILFDGRATSGPYEPLMTYESENPVCWILLYDPQANTDLAAWYGAGGHDAFRAPVSRGELLARVRAGARFLEFERRLRTQSSAGVVPGMLSRRGFLRKLSRLASTSKPEASQHTLVVTAIDWYHGIRRKGGQIASRRLVAAVARALKRTAGENAVVAYLGNGCFATLHLGQAAKPVRATVEQMTNDFGSRESQRDAIARPTLTTALVPWRADDTPEQLLQIGLDTLEIAQQSGGDCIIEQGEFMKELTAWQHEMATGNPFAAVVVQDIMEPFPAILQNDTDQSAMIDALCRSGAPLCPYVDKTGRLVGVASTAGLGSHAAGADEHRLAALPITEPITILPSATFPEIYEAFSSQGCATLVVVSDGTPLGYLTCNGFLSLIEPIDSETFAPTGEFGDETRDLVVAGASSEWDAE